MIALQIIPDRFSAAEKTQAASLKSKQSTDTSGRGISTATIRRPTNGFVLKKETFATLSVIAGKDGSAMPVVDAGSRLTQDSDSDLRTTTSTYSNFLLQQVQEERVEKQQILETFGEPYIFLFGERARMVSFQGVLINTFDFNWESEWWYNYENYLRGTRCVQNDARVFITYDNTLVGGYILSTSSTKVSDQRNWVQFNFTMFVTSYTQITPPGDSRASPGYMVNGLFYEPDETINISDQLANTFRPKLINPGDSSFDNVAKIQAGDNGTVAQPSLANSIANSIGGGMSTFNSWVDKGNRLLRNGLTAAASFMSGSTVRVPVGFEGTMAYDKGANAQLATVHYGGTVTYTTFNKNNDEYVGTSDQYASSDLKYGNFGFVSLEDQLTLNTVMVNKATAIWKEAGYEIPTSSPVGKYLAGKLTGIVGGAIASKLVKDSTLLGQATNLFGTTRAGIPSPLSI